MDKHIEVFCKQNPKTTLRCSNPNCGKEVSFGSKDVFRSKSFEFKCDRCGRVTRIDSSAMAKDLTSRLKKLGIKVR